MYVDLPLVYGDPKLNHCDWYPVWCLHIGFLDIYQSISFLSRWYPYNCYPMSIMIILMYSEIATPKVYIQIHHYAAELILYFRNYYTFHHAFNISSENDFSKLKTGRFVNVAFSKVAPKILYRSLFGCTMHPCYESHFLCRNTFEYWCHMFPIH